MRNPETERLPFLAGGGHDRADQLRFKNAELAELMTRADARFLSLGDPTAQIDDRLTRLPIAPEADKSEYCFIGFDEDGAPLFADAAPGDATGGSFLDRGLWAALACWPRIDAGLFATMHSLVDWHRRHRFCSTCGQPTRMQRGGWMRQCSACNAQHFPRVDPVVIMLAEHDGRVLLGRQPQFPERRYSALAGFIEPGEAMEDAVIRELHEEAGIRAHSVSYVASQPWPFPSQLMLACIAKCDDPALTIDTTELEDAFWASREDVVAAMAGHDSARFLAPPPLAIAHHLLAHWLRVTG